MRRSVAFALFAVLATSVGPARSQDIEQDKATVQQISLQMAEVLRSRREAERIGASVDPYDIQLQALEA